MFCSNCGAEIPEGAQFCSSCGTKVEAVTEEATEAVAEKVAVEETTTETVTEEAVVEETASEEAVVEEAVTEDAPKVDTSFYGQQNNNQQHTAYQAQAGKKNFLGDTSNMNLLQVFAIIMMLLYGIYTIRAVFGSIGMVFSVIGTMFHPYMYHIVAYIIGDLVSAILTLVCGACAAVMTVSFYGVFRNWRKEVSRKYFVVLLGAGACGAAVSILNSIITLIVQLLAYSNFYARSIFRVSGRPVILAVAGILGYYFLTNNMQAGPTEGGFQVGDEVKNALAYAKELWADLVSVINDGVANTTTADATANTAANTANDVFTPDFNSDRSTIVNPTAPINLNTPNNGGNHMYTGALKTDRSIWAYIFLGIITCGIYNLYMMYTLERDINIACDGDGDHTTSFWAYLGLSIITCGIYHFYYVYKMGNRLQRNAARYGLSFQENGTSVLMWNLFGMFLCGIGAYIAMNILLTNTNAICREYNAYNNL